MLTLTKWQIGLVEDQATYRSHFSENLENNDQIEQIHIWKSAEEFLSDDRHESLDLLFLDIMLPNMNGIDLAYTIREKNQDLKIAMITTINSDEMIFRALGAGAVGYVYKDEFYNLSEITTQIMAGGASISPTIALRVLNSFKKDTSIKESYALTTREKQVLEQLARGSSIKKSADLLGISSNTLRNHTYKIYQKLNVKNRAELVHKAASMGMI